MHIKKVTPRLPIVNIEDTRIFFRNLAGKPGKYNREGDRSFCVLLDDPKMAKDLAAHGWNIRMTKPRSEDDSPEPYVQVKVSYAKFPPKIVLIKGNNKAVYLDEGDVDLLDWAEISKVDLILNPSVWNVNGNSGVKAYLKAGYFTIVEDAFEAKYQNPADTGFEENDDEKEDV
jgi:hypothetical protein